jgi:hypothetical protein
MAPRGAEAGEIALKIDHTVTCALLFRVFCYVRKAVSPMNKLVFLSGRFNGFEHVLLEGTTTIGRSAGNTLRIDDDSVAPAHCALLVWDREVIVRDLDSPGTFVNGIRITGQAEVKEGHIIRFGNIEAQLHLGPSRFDDDTEQSAVHEYAKLLSRRPESY